MYFLNINKPKGISSFDCIKFLRKKLSIKSIGHSGTLDPLATGVMQIATGSATRLLEYLNSDKTYIADIIFGYNSTTMDDEGEKIFVKTPAFSFCELKSVLEKFIGKQKQIPPKYSAIKINGRKYCDIVRKNPNAEIEIKPREIEIYDIKLLDFKDNSARIEVSCAKGTYIRSLAQDIGAELGCGAYIKDLKRIKAGNFLIEKSDNLDSETFSKINPLDVLDFEKYELSPDEYHKISNGMKIKVNAHFEGKKILLTRNQKLISVAISDNFDNCAIIKPEKNFKEE